MNIVVTGSEGTIGRALCRYLKEHTDHKVLGIDLMHTDRGILDGYTRANIADLSQIDDALRHAHIVVNLAAEFGRLNGEEYPNELWASNVVGLKNILFLQNRYEFKLVHASSSEVYGEGPWFDSYDDRVVELYEEVTEQNALKHHNDYAMSKWVNEQQIRNHIRDTGCEVIIPRFFNSYGPRS